jgi:hypothetical protein
MLSWFAFTGQPQRIDVEPRWCITSVKKTEARARFPSVVQRSTCKLLFSDASRVRLEKGRPLPLQCGGLRAGQRGQT